MPSRSSLLDYTQGIERKRDKNSTSNVKKEPKSSRVMTRRNTTPCSYWWQEVGASNNVLVCLRMWQLTLYLETQKPSCQTCTIKERQDTM